MPVPEAGAAAAGVAADPAWVGFLRRHGLWLLLAATALRLLVAAVAPLSPDEAYYWVWSRALAPGYFDHPPMVALWIRCGTWVAGQSAFGIRLLGPFATLAGTFLIRAAGRDLIDDAAGLMAAAVLNASLLFGAGAITMTPDTPLLLFWTATLAAFARLVATGRARWWLVAGVSCGLGMDSKYTAALLPLCALAWLVSLRQWRWLRHPAPWAGGALALLLFAPTLGWNAAHHWVSFVKQGGRTLDFVPARAARYVSELVLGQIGLMTPLLFGLCLAGLVAAARAARGPKPTPRLLLAFTVLPGLVFLQHALGDRVQANWPAVIWPGAALAAALAAPAWRRALFVPGLWLGIGITALVYAHATLDILPLPARMDPVTRLGGYRELARHLRDLRPAPRFLATDSYGAAALLDFLAPTCPNLIAVGPRWRYFALPAGAARLSGGSGLLLRDTRRHNPPDREGWQSLAPVGVIDRTWHGEVSGRYRLWRVTAGAVPPVSAVMPCRPGS